MTKDVFYLKKFFGFTRTGTSLVGRSLRKGIAQREIRRVASVVLIGAFTAVVLARNLTNMGGNFALAVTTPVVTIDATTISSVQKPVEFEYESRGLSWFHAGADLVAPTGTLVRAIMAGTVREVDSGYFGYGKYIVVDHDSGYQSLYAHLSKISVTAGQKLNLATKLGEVGSTGFSTGPHLHLEVRQNGNLINPADIVPGVK